MKIFLDIRDRYGKTIKMETEQVWRVLDAVRDRDIVDMKIYAEVSNPDEIGVLVFVLQKTKFSS